MQQKFGKKLFFAVWKEWVDPSLRPKIPPDCRDAVGGVVVDDLAAGPDGQAGRLVAVGPVAVLAHLRVRGK